MRGAQSQNLRNFLRPGLGNPHLEAVGGTWAKRAATRSQTAQQPTSPLGPATEITMQVHSIDVDADAGVVRDYVHAVPARAAMEAICLL